MALVRAAAVGPRGRFDAISPATSHSWLNRVLRLGILRLDEYFDSASQSGVVRRIEFHSHRCTACATGDDDDAFVFCVSGDIVAAAQNAPFDLNSH
jgi:hypothetical protein